MATKDIQLPDPFHFIGASKNPSHNNHDTHNSHESKPKNLSHDELTRQSKQELLTSKSDSKTTRPNKVLESVVEPSPKNYSSTHRNRIAEAALNQRPLVFKRVTIVLPEGYKAKIDAYAFWTRQSLRDVFKEMGDAFLEKKEVKEALKELEKRSPEEFEKFLKNENGVPYPYQ